MYLIVSSSLRRLRAVRLASVGSHGHSDVMNAYFYQRPYYGNSFPFLSALQQAIRVATPVRQPTPVSFSRKETGVRTTAASHVVQGIAATPLVTIGMTNTEVTSNSDADDGAAAHGIDCT